MSGSESLRDWLLAEEPTSRRQARLSAWYHGWLNFRSNTLAMLGLAILVFLILCAIFAPWLASHDPFEQDLGARLLAPGVDGHLFGTDSLGRDIYSRLLYGARISIYIVLLVAMVAPALGLIIGTVAGYAGGWVDVVLMRFTDIFLAFPASFSRWPLSPRSARASRTPCWRSR
jgi:peptide/nickel transport system permease protein